MTRFYGRYVPVASGLFALVLLIIHIQPYDDQQLRSFLVPESCAMPCFLGIQPGITTVEAAVQALELSGWVAPGDVTVTSRFNIVRLEWTWNGRQPVWFQSTAQAVATVLPGFNQDSSLADGQRVITGISIFTSVPYGAAWLILGEGTDKADYMIAKNIFNPRIAAVYPDQKLALVSNIMFCPVSLSKFWNKAIVLQMGYTFIDDSIHSCQGLTS